MLSQRPRSTSRTTSKNGGYYERSPARWLWSRAPRPNAAWAVPSRCSWAKKGRTWRWPTGRRPRRASGRATRDWAGLDAVVGEIEGWGSKGLAITADVSSAAEVRRHGRSGRWRVRQAGHPRSLRRRARSGAGPGGRSGRGHLADAPGCQLDRRLSRARAAARAMLADAAGRSARRSCWSRRWPACRPILVAPDTAPPSTASWG